MTTVRPTSSARVLPTLALGAALIAASLPIAALAAAPDPGAREVAAVFPPWWTASRALIAASRAGSLAASGGARGVVIVRSDTPGLAARLRAAGALLLLDASGRGDCGPATTDQGSNP